MLRVRHRPGLPHLQLRPVQGNLPQALRQRRDRAGRDAVQMQHPRARGRRAIAEVLPEQGHDMGRSPEQVHRRTLLPRRSTSRATSPRSRRRRARTQDLRIQLRGPQDPAPNRHRIQPARPVRAIPDAGQHRDGVPGTEQRTGASGTLRPQRDQIHLGARRRAGAAAADTGRRSLSDGVGERHAHTRLRHGSRDADARVPAWRGSSDDILDSVRARQKLFGGELG